MAEKKKRTSKKASLTALVKQSRKATKVGPLAEDADGFWILPKDRKERNVYLTRIFSQELSAHETFAARMKVMQGKLRIPRGTLYRLADAMDWRRYVREDSEVREMRQLAEMLGTPDDVSLVSLTDQTKNFLYMAVTSSSSILRHCGRMINYYVVKMEKLIIEAAGLDNLTVAQRSEFKHWEGQLLFYKDQMTPFINTQALVRGMSMMGVGGELADAMNQMDGGALTPAMLQKQLLEMGLANMQRIPGVGGAGGAISDRSYEEIVSEIEVPDLDGRKIKHDIYGVRGTYADDDKVDEEEDANN